MESKEKIIKNKRETTLKIIRKEGLRSFLRNPTVFTKDYGSEKEREKAKKICKKEYGTDECQVMTIEEAYDECEELVATALKKGKKSNIFNYIDIEAIIRDETYSGSLTYTVLKNGNFYLVRVT